MLIITSHEHLSTFARQTASLNNHHDKTNFQKLVFYIGYTLRHSTIFEKIYISCVPKIKCPSECLPVLYCAELRVSKPCQNETVREWTPSYRKQGLCFRTILYLAVIMWRRKTRRELKEEWKETVSYITTVCCGLVLPFCCGYMAVPA
jgi:hypothetical protein